MRLSVQKLVEKPRIDLEFCLFCEHRTWVPAVVVTCKICKYFVKNFYLETSLLALGFVKSFVKTRILNGSLQSVHLFKIL